MNRNLWLAFAVTTVLVGCAGAAGSGLLGITVTVLTAFTVIACSSSEGETSGNTDVTTVADVIDAVTSDATAPDAGGECDGVWEDCCANDGTIEKCCCPQGAECNYGTFNVCDDGTCIYGNCLEPEVTEDVSDPQDVPDVVEPQDTPSPEDTPTLEDVPVEEDTVDPTCDGTWEACCVDGEVTECCCPEGAVCNYGIYEICDDGSCTIGPCDVPDAGSKEDVPTPSEDVPTPIEEDVSNPPDKDTMEEMCDGTWETCCVNNQIDTCCCPQGVACNYGWFETCDDGSCSFPGGCEDSSM